MDSSSQGFLLVATTMILLLIFCVAVLAIMIIYRRRRVQHHQEITLMESRFERDMLQSQLEIQRQTMQHISREIHDNVGSKLTLAFLNTHHIDLTDAYQVNQLEGVSQLIDEAIQDLRSLSANLQQGHVEPSTTLEELLRQECSKLNAIHFCEVTFSASGTLPSGNLAVNSFILRIFQEFAQNSLKHGKCTTLHLAMEQRGNDLVIHAEDNGIGFILGHQNHQGGIGLRNMRHRASMIGANYSLQSNPTLGTQLTLSLSPSSLNKTISHA